MKIPSSMTTTMSGNIQNTYSQIVVAANQQQLGMAMPYESVTRFNVVGGMPNMFDYGKELSLDPKKAFQILEKKSLWAASNTMQSYYESLSKIVDKGDGKIVILDEYQKLEANLLSFNITPGSLGDIFNNSMQIKALLRDFTSSINNTYQAILQLEQDLKNERDAHFTNFSIDKEANDQFNQIKQTNPQHRAPLYQDFLHKLDELSVYCGVKNCDPKYNKNLTLTASQLVEIQNQNSDFKTSGIDAIQEIKNNQDYITGKLPAFELLQKEITEIKEEFCKLAHISKIKINEIIQQNFIPFAFNGVTVLQNTGWIETSGHPNEVIRFNDDTSKSSGANFKLTPGGGRHYTFYTTSSQQEVKDGWRAIAINGTPTATTTTLKELATSFSVNIVQKYQRYDKNANKYANEANQLNNARKHEVEFFISNQLSKMRQMNMILDVIMKLMKDSCESISQIMLR